MPLDPNIILQGRPVQIGNPMEYAQTAMTMKQLAMQNQALEKKTADEGAIQQILKKNTVTGPDGKTRIDQSAAMSDLYKVNPQKAMEYEKQFQTSELDTLKYHNQIGKEIAFKMTPENYSEMRQKAIQSGLPNSEKLPEQYSPEFVQRLQVSTLNSEEQIKKAESDREFQLKQQNAQFDQQKFGADQSFKQKQFGADQGWKDKDHQVKLQELGIKRIEAERKTTSGENLPIDKKHEVTTLATKNANKIAIKNQIDSTMANWDNLSDDEKVTMGRSLLKTLNSTEGSDAVGAEEAKRLGAMLETDLFANVFNSNPIQFGRNLDGFKKQAVDTSKNIGGAVESNQKRIDQSMGRKSEPSSNTKTINGQLYRKVEGGWLPAQK